MPPDLLSLPSMPDMSEKKSPPQKEKAGLLRTPTGAAERESKAFKRKLLSPESTDDEDKKVTPKRKRPLGLESPDPGNSSSPRGGHGNVTRLSVPLSERQQMALLMRMTDESSQGDSSPKPSSPPQSVTSTKRSQADKKVNKRNERGETPLHIAAKRGDVKQTRKLIKAGASVNVADYAGWTPLHEACNLGNVDVAKQLLKAGANVNVLGLGDETPLHDAAINNHSKLVTILLKHGANPLQSNVKGETPLDVAIDVNIKKKLGREIISSNSETSSIDEVRSPTSPESLASIKDEDRGLDVEDLKPRSSSLSMVRGDNSCLPGSIGVNRRMSLPPKSPVDKSLSSPSPHRLFLKFKSAGSSSGEETGSYQGVSSRKSSDSKEPMFKSYILTMDTGDQPQQRGGQGRPGPHPHPHPQHLHPNQHRGVGGRINLRPSPACSPLPPMEVDGQNEGPHKGVGPDPHHPHHQHKKPADPWEAVVGNGGGSGNNNRLGLNNSIGVGHAQNNVSSIPSCGGTVPLSSSSVFSSSVPSLKMQCVRPDSSEEESNNSRSSHHPAPLQRLRTEPFTPNLMEDLSDDDVDEKRGNVFEDKSVKSSSLRMFQQTNNVGIGGPPRLSPNPNMVGGGPTSSAHPPPPHLHGQRSSQQHIPSVETSAINHHSPNHVSAKHRTTHLPSLGASSHVSSSQSMDVASVCVSRSTTSGVSSTTGSHSADKDTSFSTGGPGSKSVFGTQHSGGGCGSSSNNGTGVLSNNIGGVSGSVSGSSSLVNCTGSGVVSSASAGGLVEGGTNMLTSVSSSVGASSCGGIPSSANHPQPFPQRWDSAPRLRPERGTGDRSSPKPFPQDAFPMDKTDSVSAGSPLQQMEVDENLSSSPPLDRDGDGRNAAGPLKVPPLKIILPSQKASAAERTPDAASKTQQGKVGLPYVVKGEWVPEMAEGGAGGDKPALAPTSTTPALPGEDLLAVNTLSPSRPSRPSSRASNKEEGRNSNKPSSPSPLVKDGGVGSDREDEMEEGDRLGGEEEGREGTEDKAKRPTRMLRSHTAQKQQEQKQQKGGGPGKADTTKEVQEKVLKPDQKEEAETIEEVDTTSDVGNITAQPDDVHVPPRKRKLRAKTEAQSREQSDNKDIVLEKPPNPYELYLNLRRQQMRNRHKMMSSVTPKLPTGFKDYLMVNCTYVLQGNTTSTLSVPMLTPPMSCTGAMRDLFLEQERARYRLRLQHHIEREKLMLAIEQEILREHARAARAVANQNQPLSVCTILCEEEIYNLQELDQGEDRDKSSRSRYNGRQFYSWLQDVGDKYDNIKTLLLLRHHHEAESLHAVQKMDWEWKLKESGQCDAKATPNIDGLHLPMVQVNDEFELLPPQRLRPS